ncbi:MAG: nucleotide exchange factor GrpE [Thermosulfidibacteraceae bacterium]|jgi:molecular chaperone GrpE
MEEVKKEEVDVVKEKEVCEERSIEEEKNEVELLRETIERLSNDKKEIEEKYIRVLAELDNFRKRMEKEIARIKEIAEERVVRDILIVLDNFERALDSLEKGVDFNSFTEGVKLIYRQMKEILFNFGLEEIEALNKPFDPLLHDALMVVQDDSRDGIVVQVVEKGYKLRGNLIRPAKVIVAKKPKEEEKVETGEEKE